MSLESYKESYEFVTAALTRNAELEQMISYEEFASKTLLIAIAGQHEREIVSILTQMAKLHNAPDFISDFIEKQALKRRYHSLFNWDSKKINTFAGLFGTEMKTKIINHCGDLQSTKDFFFIGGERNRIVHNGLATESIDKTFLEIWELYESSKEFIVTLKSLFHSTPQTNP